MQNPPSITDGNVFIEASTDVESEKSVLPNLTGVEKLGQNLKDLLLSGEDFDTTINVKGKEFRIHRLILGVRSSVFKSMFKHNTTECSSGVINISDCDPDVFQDFLMYLYSGKVEKFTIENVIGLYALADKYDTQEVKLACVEFMINNTSVDNFCDIFVLAVLHEEKKLFKKSTDFFVQNAKKITVTVKWQCFLKEHPVEANELFIKALAYAFPD